MRVVIHAGMNKTGSSSIQQTFSRQSMDAFHYPEWRSRNHSDLLALLFHEPVEDRPRFRERGQSREDLLAERAAWSQKLADLLQSRAHPGLLLSAESVSGSLSPAAERMAAFFDRYSDDVRIIAYVRPPISFMQSAFQQRVRGGQAKRLRLSALWPDYRARFEPLDAAFGRERVILKKFAPAALRGGDVVQDFAHELGVAVDPERVVRANVGVSLEALAFLFAERRLAPREGGAGEMSGRANRRFMAALEAVGTTKLTFAPSVTGPIVAQHRADLDWMEARLGEPLLDLPPASASGGIASEEDLMAVAEDNRDRLEGHLIALIQADTEEPYGRLVRNLDLLRKVYY